MSHTGGKSLSFGIRRLSFSVSLHPDETIAALASAPGSAVRGIIRVSGPHIRDVLCRLLPAEAAVLSHRLPWRTEVLVDIGLSRPLPVDLYYWPSRRSYTGEPLAEFHTIGSPPLLEALQQTLCRVGARLAQPGEFTLRAFLAGRLDLTQAEAVLGVIDAHSDAELRCALDQLAGGTSSAIGRLRTDLLELLADLEAGLDFAHEDLAFVTHDALVARLKAAHAAITTLRQQAATRSRSSTQFRVVLAGPPNAGKSTLFNALAGRAAALVSPEKGTTRDYLIADADCDGLMVQLIDTAGMEDVCLDLAAIESQAQSFRQSQMETADLTLWCLPAAIRGTNPDIKVDSSAWLQVWTQSDRLPISPECDNWNEHELVVSAVSKSGLGALRSAIRQHFDTQPGETRWLGSTAARCQTSLEQAEKALDSALEIAVAEADQSLLAFELRTALDALGEIVGAVYTDDILDRIFSRFCIGK